MHSWNAARPAGPSHRATLCARSGFRWGLGVGVQATGVPRFGGEPGGIRGLAGSRNSPSCISSSGPVNYAGYYLNFVAFAAPFSTAGPATYGGVESTQAPTPVPTASPGLSPADRFFI